MRMNGSELFEAFEQDFASPMPEDTGARIAEVMEAKLTALMDKYEKKLQELTEATAINPDNPEALEKIAESLPADPEPEEGGGADA